MVLKRRAQNRLAYGSAHSI
uniref:Uncharacterized protein n=1 Tax=Anopheles christyi TaxID=43041 RepID=A0A182KJ38_9DIPT